MSDDVLNLARVLAKAAHASQVDKAGEPYIGHPERVAARVWGGDLAKATAWLHDVIEDTNLTLRDLADAGIPHEVRDAVDHLTRRDGETPDDYYARVSRNRMAVQVKLADIGDNSDPERLAMLDVATRDRLVAKYAKARVALDQAIIRYLS